jgi:Fis family transcriptional regulator
MNSATFFADTKTTNTNATTTQGQSLRGCVEQAMENYFKHLDGQDVSDVYDMVMAEVEAPMY